MPFKAVTVFLFTFCFCHLSIAQTPFSYETMVALCKPGPNSSAPNYTLYTTTTPSNGASYTILGNPINLSDREVNGIGLNTTDMFLYAAAISDNGTPNDLTDDSKLYRIGANGVSVNLGTLPITGQGYTDPNTGTFENINYTTGAVKNDKYIYSTLAFKQSGYNKLAAASFGISLNLNADDIRIFVAEVHNISTINATPITPDFYYELDCSHPQVKAAINGYLQGVNNNFNSASGSFGDKLAAISNSNGGFQDFDISPTDGNLYSYISYPDPTPDFSPVDVVGFPLKVTPATTSGGTAIVTPLSSTINEEPHVELSGLAFDLSGALYAMFASGEYGKINLNTGAVEGIVNCSIFSSSYGTGDPNPNHLRGDLARPVKDPALSVQFGFINADIIGQTLTVNWQTLCENNNDHFDIEVSTDGAHFTKAGTVMSKSNSNNTTTALEYSFNIVSNGLPISVLSLGIFGIFGCIGFKNRRRIKLLTVAAIVVTLLGINACNKSSDTINTSSDKQIYVRIAQVDKDGTTTYSKVFKAVKK